MANIRIDGVLLIATLATSHTVTTGQQATSIELWFHNNDTVDRKVTVHFIASGGAAGDANKVIERTLAKDETIKYKFQVHLEAGDFIQWKADVTLKVSAHGGILQEAV